MRVTYHEKHSPRASRVVQLGGKKGQNRQTLLGGNRSLERNTGESARLASKLLMSEGNECIRNSMLTGRRLCGCADLETHFIFQQPNHLNRREQAPRPKDICAYERVACSDA